ncbi:MAG: OsmC family protein [Planctomycetes bacterium]|nr:OsmC family protein [Planctomycetota bacterium]
MATVFGRSVGSRYITQVTMDRHSVIVDEPTPLGDDLGPSPYELLLSALGACTSMTLLMYARRKGWALRQVQIELSHDREHAQDCDDCEQDGARIEVIRRQIILEGDLDAEQRDRLREIATRCPVHKTLSSGTRIIDEVV